MMDANRSNFDSFDFSDGESFVATSDAENTDFGWGQGKPSGPPPDGPVDDAHTPEVAQALGTTPEPATGFGTQPDARDFDYGIDANSQATKKGTPVAGRLSTRATPIALSTNSGGGTKFAQTDPGSLGSAVAQEPGPSTGAAAQLNTSPGVMSQVEGLITKTFTGQYKPNTGAAAPVASTGKNHHLLIVGGALVLLALLWKGN